MFPCQLAPESLGMEHLDMTSSYFINLIGYGEEGGGGRDSGAQPSALVTFSFYLLDTF